MSQSCLAEKKESSNTLTSVDILRLASAKHNDCTEPVCREIKKTTAVLLIYCCRTEQGNRNRECDVVFDAEPKRVDVVVNHFVDNRSLKTDKREF